VKVAILGCGPAGLIAAEELSTLGHSVNIYSRANKSNIAGAQFIHERLGWYCNKEPDYHVWVEKHGTREGYAENVYGDPKAETSWDNFKVGKMPAWDMRATYDRLWSAWEGRVIDAIIDPFMVDALLEYNDMIFSSVPLTAICRERELHTFQRQPVIIVQGHNEASMPGQQIMHYNGLPPTQDGPLWYRFSSFNGHQSWEYNLWRGEAIEPRGGWEIVKINKPLRTNCDCFDDVIRIGRYGCWDKKILTHHIQRQVRDALQ
jgi:hypothetical protein